MSWILEGEIQQISLGTVVEWALSPQAGGWEGERPVEVAGGETAWRRLLCVRGKGLCRVGWPAACDSGDPGCSCVQLTWVQPLEHSSECFFPRSNSVAVRCRTAGGGQVLGAPDPVAPGQPPKTGLRLPCGTEAGARGRAVPCCSGAPFWKPSLKPSLSSLTVI